MKDVIYIVFNKYGVRGIRKTLPQLRSGEFATKLVLKVDDKFFKQIVPEATMELDDKFLIEPKIELSPQPIENVSNQEENDDVKNV